MNRQLETIKKLFKPYRYTIKNNCTIIETETGKFVVKEKRKKNIKELYNYLKSRGFINFPNLIDDSRNDLNVYEYLEEVNTPKEQKALDMVNLVSILHNKTSYYKEVSSDAYQEIYENINNNLEYLKDHYSKLISQVETEVHPSPSHYLLVRNSSKILSMITFAKKELDEWYELVKDENKCRVAVIHNNLNTDHFFRAQDDYLISWDESKIDSPVLEMVKFYQNEYYDLSFDEILNRYFSKFPFTESEKKLFFLMISIPKEVVFEENEFRSCKKIQECLDYIYKTEELTRPYYAPQEETQKTDFNK